MEIKKKDVRYINMFSIKKKQSKCQFKVWEETDQENIFGENKECDMAISYQAPGVLSGGECFEIDNK